MYMNEAIHALRILTCLRRWFFGLSASPPQLLVASAQSGRCTSAASGGCAPSLQHGSLACRLQSVLVPPGISCAPPASMIAIMRPTYVEMSLMAVSRRCNSHLNGSGCVVQCINRHAIATEHRCKQVATGIRHDMLVTNKQAAR